MSTEDSLNVREMRLDEVGLRIDYFHDATDSYLHTLGVARELLPARADWAAFYEHDYAEPVEARSSYQLVWELDGRIVGFSSTDRIVFGKEAFMHLHIVDPVLRRRGLGTRFVELSAAQYFAVLELERLYCEPNAYNVAPNRTLQRAGFDYVMTHESAPSSINFTQPITRWVLERASGRNDLDCPSRAQSTIK